LLGRLIGPTCVVIVASLLQKYPFDASRLDLVTLPQVCLLFGAGLDYLESAVPRRVAGIWWGLAVPIIGIGFGISVSRLIQPHFRSHIRPAVAFVREHRQPGEAIYL